LGANQTESRFLDEELAERGWFDISREMVDGAAEERDNRGAHIPAEVFRESATRGLLTVTLPTELGGEGRSPAHWGRLLQRMGYHCGDLSFPMLLNLFSAMAGSVAQGGEGFRKLAEQAGRGEALTAFAYTENTDAFSWKTTATFGSNRVVLDGAKSIVSGAGIADRFVVYARAPATNDPVAVLVDRAAPGVRVTPVQSMGLRSSGLARVELEKVEVERDRVLIKNDAVSHAQRYLDRGRVMLSCATVGRARRVIEECVQQLVETTRYERRLADLENVQASVGRMRLALHTAEVVLERALGGLEDRAFTWTSERSMAKHTVTECCLEISREVMRVTGGRGYTGGQRFERDARDFAGMIAGAGAQNTLEVDLGVTLIADLERRWRFTDSEPSSSTQQGAGHTK
jgi:alkylation response protein AidB-like acyl-CoA dehydrogenase